MDIDENLALSLPYIEQLQAAYARDAAAVPPEWRRYFDESSHNGKALDSSCSVTDQAGVGRLHCLADDLVHAYRVRGHLLAKIDPLGMRHIEVPELEPRHYGLTDADLDCSLANGRGSEAATVRSLVERMQAAYCGSIGVQFMHIDDLEIRTWLQQRLEGDDRKAKLSPEMQRRILTRLTDAVLFEESVRKKHIGAKTFSLEGSETLIPLLDLAIEKAAAEGVVEIVMGMAHRGRLNVLANIIGKRMQDIFWEFQDTDAPEYRHGDVRYHLGYSSDWKTAAGKSVHLSLCFNPSHLEFVNPVVLGRLRAKLDRASSSPDKGLAVLIHGDAAFAGQGVVQETLNLGELAGYSVGGALHIIVNNQIGFTTSPDEARSTQYATAVAKMMQIPIFHVNGEDPEAVAEVVSVALDFRRQYHRDVIIDMYGYRRLGHNEEDEPSFTQPVLYREIRQREGVRDRYLHNLLKAGQVTQQQADEIAERRMQAIQAAFESAKLPEFRPQAQYRGGYWSGFFGGAEPRDEPETGIELRNAVRVLERLVALPEGFHLHPKLQRLFDARRAMAKGERPLDWATAEALALGSLATGGYRVRLTGQDTARGTFSQRHAVLHDYEDGHTWCPLEHIDSAQAPVRIINSPLSEVAALGFEYGYSLDYPEALVAWEAQFGDFVNAAQVIIDQFIASAEEKWHRLSGLTMLLPHGWEGQGPEHSSARLERWLMMAANENYQVIQPSTPAQHFHALRRQVVRSWRKPLFVLTPKSLLRHTAVVSPLEDFVAGRFRRVIADQRPAEHQGETNRILLCSGKIYYDLVEARQQRERQDVAIVRLEQFYPLPARELNAALAAYSVDIPVVWIQQEPANMGAWQFLRMHWDEAVDAQRPLRYIARPAASSPASGSRRVHIMEEERLVEAAFALDIRALKANRPSETEDILR